MNWDSNSYANKRFCARIPQATSFSKFFPDLPRCQVEAPVGRKPSKAGRAVITLGVSQEKPTMARRRVEQLAERARDLTRRSWGRGARSGRGSGSSWPRREVGTGSIDTLGVGLGVE